MPWHRLIFPGMMLRSAVGRLVRLSGREWRDVAAAQVALVRAQATVYAARRGGPRSLLEAATTPGDPLAYPEPSEDQWMRVAEIERALHRAVRFGIVRPQPKCLARVIALTHLLRAAGIGSARVRIGVRRGVRRGDPGFAAHAWVEMGRPARVVGDTPAHIAEFTPLATESPRAP